MLGNIFIVHIKPKTKYFFSNHKQVYTYAPIIMAMITFKGMHDTVTVWTDNGRHKLRKHYLVMHLQEAHQLFCQLYPTEGDGNISFSKFCSLHPKNVLLTGDTPQCQCKCMIHGNFFLKLEALVHSYGRYVLLHINTKQIQLEDFEKDKVDPTE